MREPGGKMVASLMTVMMTCLARMQILGQISTSCHHSQAARLVKSTSCHACMHIAQCCQCCHQSLQWFVSTVWILCRKYAQFHLEKIALYELGTMPQVVPVMAECMNPGFALQMRL